MKNFTKLLINSVLITVVLTLILGVLYPLAITGLSLLLFPHQANGSMIRVDGKIVGSSLIGQSFGSPKFFHGRPSAAGDGYDPTKSGGSNLGPTSQALHDRIAHDVDSLHKLYPSLPSQLPADMLTTSGSGLDPDITVANALVQAPIVSQATGLNPAQIMTLIAKHTEHRFLGFLGEERVNVLELNIDLLHLERK